jgi:hypothetical protein
MAWGMPMSQINGMADALQQIGRFSWSDFSIVRFFSFEQNGQDKALVHLTVESDNRPVNWRITIKARDVQDLRLSGWNGYETRAMGFDGVEMSEGQWEDLHWKVYDYEGDVLHFYCGDLAIERIEPVR